MSKTIMKTAVLPLVLAFMAIGCENEEGENETKISAYGDMESHHVGDNCLSCHRSGGSGEGWFTVAGTVYQPDLTTPYPDATVRLHTGADGTGTLAITVEVDGRGNFYTTRPVDWGTGLYASVSSASDTSAMLQVVSSGACNSCHDGVSTARIHVE
jgi:mono/diheme cytochrome c family protein